MCLGFTLALQVDLTKLRLVKMPTLWFWWLHCGCSSNFASHSPQNSRGVLYNEFRCVILGSHSVVY